MSAAGGLFWVAAAACLWGTVGIASKAVFGLSAVSPLQVGFLRLAVSVPVLLGIGYLLLGSRMFGFRRGALRLLFVLGAAMALYQAFYFAAVAAAGVAVATLVTICTAPPLVAVLASVLLRERFTRTIAAAFALALTGTILLVGFPAAPEVDHTELVTGVALASGSAASYAVFTLCSRSLAAEHHPLQLITVGFGIGALLLLPVVLAQGGVSLAIPASAGWLLLYMGLVPTGLAYVLYFAGMRATPATVATVATLMEPLTATFLAWMIFDERLGPVSALGGGLLLLAVAALARGAARGRWGQA